MDLKTLAPWIYALRSGNYPQTKKTLCDENGFCCLGVASVVLGIASKEQMQVSGVQTEGPLWVYNILRDKLPSHIVDQGIVMNDRGYSFAEIADMIEKELTQ